MMDAFMGTIMPWPINYAPQGWALCHGQEIQISQNPALYSLLGTYYGGDGYTTFKLPDLRGRVPIGQGTGPGLSPRNLGQMGGFEAVTLTEQQMPAHNHAIPASTAEGTIQNPSSDVCLAKSQNTRKQEIDIYTSEKPDTTIKPTENSGAGIPHDNMPPYLAINYIICIQGYYPPRS